MPKHLVSVRVTKHGKFRKTHVAEINAPTPDEALRHLRNRCAPGGELARKFPGVTFSDFELADATDWERRFWINSATGDDRTSVRVA